MSLANALSLIVVPKGDLNAFRAPPGPPHYEVYYLTLNHRPSRTGFWIRYTLDLRGPQASKSEAAMWFHCFRRDDPLATFGGKQRFEPSAISRGEDFCVRVGESIFAEGRAQGAAFVAGRRASWDLSFEPSKEAVWYIPWPLRNVAMKSTLVTPNLGVRFSGKIAVDGETLNLSNEPGCQTHMWGPKRRREGWAWGECYAFDGDAPCSVMSAAGSFKRGGREMGPLGIVFIRYRGEDYLCNTIPGVWRARAKVEFPNWSFVASSRKTRFACRYTTSREAMVQVCYEDPDGGGAYCCNTEVADAVLEVWRGDRLVEILRSTGAAHVEFVSREERPDVRVTVP